MTQAIGKERKQRRLSAIMVIDVVGFSKLMEADEASTLSTIQTLRSALLEPRIAEHSGRVVKFLGDGALAEFFSAVDAVECAASIQKRLLKESATNGPLRSVQLRIGVNVGDVVVDGDDLLGDGVNVASRLEQLCDVGGVLISGTVYDQIHGKARIKVKDRGTQRAKNISRPIRTYSITLPKPKKATTPTQSSHPSLNVGIALILVVGFVVLLIVLSQGIGTIPAGSQSPSSEAPALLANTPLEKTRLAEPRPELATEAFVKGYVAPPMNTPLVNSPPESPTEIFGQGFVTPVDNGENTPHAFTTDILIPVTDDFSIIRSLIHEGVDTDSALEIRPGLDHLDFNAGQWLRIGTQVDSLSRLRRVVRFSLYDANDEHIATMARSSDGTFAAAPEPADSLHEYQLEFPGRKSELETSAYYDELRRRHPQLAPFTPRIVEVRGVNSSYFVLRVGRFGSLSQALEVCEEIKRNMHSSQLDYCFPILR